MTLFSLEMSVTHKLKIQYLVLTLSKTITMKTINLLLALLLFWACSSPKNDNKDSEPTAFSDPDDLIGAWETTWIDSDGKEKKAVTILADGYIGEAVYSPDGSYFYDTYGGLWEAKNDTFYFTYEFNTSDTTLVGNTISMAYEITGDTIDFSEDDRIWTRVDDGTPGELANAWLITGRKRDGEISRRTPGVRKTMKILSGTRFQWIAYNTETTQFFGTGGGIYTTLDGKYTENIRFFSRDSSRVGAALEFDYKLDSGEWHHSGFSSKGDPMYEIWTPRSMLEN